MSPLPLLAALAPALAGGGLTVRLEQDIVQRRDVVEPGLQVVELARILPPTEEPWTLVVGVPDAWVERPRGAGLTPAQLSASTAPQVRALVHAVRRDVPGAGGLAPVEAGGFWAGILRCSSYEVPVPVSHYDQVLEPWEVLYDARAGDTLSSSMSALMALSTAGVPARLARYPTPATATKVAFGLLVAGQAPAQADWAWPVSGADPPQALLPLHLKARPEGAIQAAALASWSLAEVLAPGWGPGVDAGSGGGAAPVAPEPASPDPAPPPAPAPPPPPDRTPRPDVCAQARAMGLTCKPVDRSLDPAYLGIAIAGAVALAAAGVAAAVARIRRGAVAEARRARRRGEEF